MEAGQAWHAKSIEQLIQELETNLEKGLSQEDAQKRLEQYGQNELLERPRAGFLTLLLRQFNNFLVWILIGAAGVSLMMGELVDAAAILVIVGLNAIVGVAQESKAEQALAALRKMATPNAQVLRGGHQVVIPSRDLVPGDLVLIEAGNYIPADLRLVESVNLKVEEASLTGESMPVDKEARVVLDKQIPLGDRKNLVFMGTLISYGRGKGMVTATGMHTQIGLIAEMLQDEKEEATPLQKKLAQLGKVLGIACLAICTVIFVYGLLRDTEFGTLFTQGWIPYLTAEKEDIIELFMTAVSLAIAAVPEGLPAVVTICLALGMQRMIRRHALIRKLPAVETLGCATVICSDKTGTLTQNEMTVVQGWTNNKRFRVTGEGYHPKGQFFGEGKIFNPLEDIETSLLLSGGVLCNDAKLEESREGRGEIAWRMVGDPTEVAVVVAAGKAGLWRTELEETLPRVQEIPFDSERKRMTTIHRRKDRKGETAADVAFPDSAFVAFVKGAPDVILDLCDQILEGRKGGPLSPEKQQEVMAVHQDMARQALRVLAVAFRPIDSIAESPAAEEVERGLTFIGLFGMIDPARPEVKEAVKVAQRAGLRSVMVTGDFKETAEAVAKEIGLLTPGGLVLTGEELDRLNESELVNTIDRVDACCRVSPQHKLKIVDAFKARGHVVAMTGDGVNDAPALKRADIGVAMGKIGSDVSKEAADMVLMDDNFATIVSAIEEGRIIYSDIRKFVFFLIACNVGEILIIFCSMLAGIPIPLRPIHLLLLNLVTDGAPALALGLEKGEPNIMDRPPRPAGEPVINRPMLVSIVIIALADMIAVLMVFIFALSRFPGNLIAAQTMAFATLVSSELLRAYTSRSESYSVFSIGLFSNPWMVLATTVSFLLLIGVLYIPLLQPFAHTVPLGMKDWLFMLPFMFVAPVVAEMIKIFLRRKSNASCGLRRQHR